MIKNWINEKDLTREEEESSQELPTPNVEAEDNHEDPMAAPELNSESKPTDPLSFHIITKHKLISSNHHKNSYSQKQKDLVSRLD